MYTDAAGDAYELINARLSGPALAYIGEGTQNIAAYGADAEVLLSMYDDGTCEVSLSLFGNATSIDVGTYAMHADYSISFVFDVAGELTATLNGETRAIELQYACEETPVGAVDTLLTIGKAE